jgi:hypothetical protein
MEHITHKASMIYDLFVNLHSPRPASIVLAIWFWGFQFLGMINHSELNLWLASFVSIFAAIRYISDFIKWLKKKK